MKRKARKPGQETGLNMTPVLSIAFIILLFFVVAAPFMQERGYDVWRDQGHGCEFVTVVIFVDRKNSIFVTSSDGPRQVDLRSVRTIVARRLAEGPRCGVLVHAHPRSDMGTVIRVVDQAKLARDPPPAVSIATVETR